MTTQQTDIEKTLKRILARKLKEWPVIAQGHPLTQAYDGSLFVYCADLPEGYETIRTGIRLEIADDIASDGGTVTRAEWAAERYLLASEQAQPVGIAEEFDQALWDKVAKDLFVKFSIEFEGDAEVRETAENAFNSADAFMAERAKRIAARKASHD